MYKYLKRPLDFLISLIALVILSPIFLIIALWIKFNSKGPVFFRQKRVGKNKELFEIYKFRSMRTDTPADMPTHLLNDPKAFLTSSGKFLRKTSLDELPQLINIVKGEMAIIGPRPALWNQYDLIEERDKYGANDVRPGLSGWAQINGRDELEIPVKAKLDGDYVSNISLVFDLKCIFGTISSVLRSDGVVEGGTGVIEKAKKEVNNR
ncbi:sugar transferase [Aerococcus viridans]|uniref:sugar transferase n=1 Tax=Aerococcus viridans TaxID=1377 RepID=UPI00382CAD03